MTTPPVSTPRPAPVRIGLLGTGPWAQSVHAPVLAAHPGVELSGVWGRRPEAAAELAAAHATTAYDEVDALFAASDAVAIALPPDIQAPLAVRAAAAGCHLLLDKPVATTVGGARAVVEAAQHSDVASVVFFTLRFAPEVAAWISEQNAAQDWYVGRAHWLGALFSPGADSPFAASPWRREKGGLWDVGPHALSVLLPLLGDATEVTAAGRLEDAVHVALRHASGASSSLTLSLNAPVKSSGVHVELRGDQSVATMPESWDGGALVSFAAAIDALLDSIRTGVSHPCDVRFGLRITEILAEAAGQLHS